MENVNDVFILANLYSTLSKINEAGFHLNYYNARLKRLNELNISLNELRTNDQLRASRPYCSFEAVKPRSDSYHMS